MKKTGGSWNPADPPKYFIAGNTHDMTQIAVGYKDILIAVNELSSEKRVADLFLLLDRGHQLFIDSGVFWLTNEHKRAHGCSFEAALGDSTQPIALYRTPANAGAHYVMCKGTIPQMRVDDLGLDACDLIALDVEGYELPALRGAAETIRRCKPTLVAEAKGHGARFGYSNAALERWVTALGYVHVATIGRDRVWTLPSSG